MIRFKKIYLTNLFLICCTFTLQSETIGPIIVSGYIDQLDPAVILIEELADEIILSNKELPPKSKVGMWVDLQVTKNSYVVLHVNQAKTSTTETRVKKLQRQLRE